MMTQNFNSHTREGVTESVGIASPLIANFNSHTREGVTPLEFTPLLNRKISTHTPVRV